MNLKSKILETSNDKLIDFFMNNENYLVQQTIEWSNLIEENDKDKKFFIIALNNDEKIAGVLTVFLFETEFGSILTSTPLFGGYGGVVLGEDSNSESIYSLLLHALIDFAKEKNCALVTITSAPFYAKENLYDKYFRQDFSYNNFYQFFDLQKDFWNNLNGKQRTNVKRNLKIAENNNLEIKFLDNLESFPRWYEIHQHRMKELNSEPIPKKFFESLFKNLKLNETFWFATLTFQNEMIGGCLFVGNNNVVDIFMQSGDSKFFYLQGNTFLIYEAIKFFKSRGIKYLNWESSPSQNSGVYKFKKNLGAKESYHRYLTKITGDVSKIIKMRISQLKRNFGTRFVLPYSELEKNNI